MRIRKIEEMVNDQLIVKHYAGSISYGTNVPTSDTDFRGIFCLDKEWLLSPWLSGNEFTDNKEEDSKVYELTKFMRLLVDQNPNIVETLWVDPKHVTHTSAAYDYLVENREKLLSSKCAFTFSGYAHAQMKRIKGHNKWINNPQPESPPRQIDYISLVHDFTSEKRFKFTSQDMEKHRENHRLVPFGSNVFALFEENGRTLYDDRYLLNAEFDSAFMHRTPLVILKFNQDQYDDAKRNHTNYWNWKQNRNQARSELEEKFGFDTKHASHLIRLLRMCVEILDEGVVKVHRPDATELLDIRAGKYSYDEIIREAEDLEAKSKQLYKTTSLQKSVNSQFATKTLLTAQELIWYK